VLYPDEHPDANAAARLRENARPRDIYRLAVIIEGLLDSAEDPDALKTIRAELRELIQDLDPADPR
jgi:hypothetical protein